MKRFLSIGILLSFFLGCSDGASSQGPSTETSGISARILDSSATALSGVVVRVVAQSASWRSTLAQTGSAELARGTTDGEGRIHFEVDSREPVALELDDTLRAGRLEVTPGGDSLHEFRASTGSRLRIRANIPSERITQMLLAGTGYRAAPQTDGSWLFRGVMRGGYTVVAVTDSGLTLLGQVVLDRPTMDTTLASDLDSVLIEDFALDASRNRYGALLGAGWWYTVTDASEGGNSKTTPRTADMARTSCSDGFCLDMEFSLDPTRSSRYALVGMDLDESLSAKDPTGLADFSKVTSVRFRASGGGAMLFQLAVWTPGGYSACHTPFSLTSTLSTLDIPISSLSCDSADADFRRVYGMTWTATSDGHLILGRVALVGAGPRDVFRKLRSRQVQ